MSFFARGVDLVRLLGLFSLVQISRSRNQQIRIRWDRVGQQRQHLRVRDFAQPDLGPFARRFAAHPDSHQAERAAGQQHEPGLERRRSLYSQPWLHPRETRGSRPNGGLHEGFPSAEIVGLWKSSRPTGSYRRWPVARTFKRSFVFEAELATNRLFLSDDTHSFERRTYSSRCLTSRNLCFEPSYNWSDKGFAHPSPEQRQ